MKREFRNPKSFPCNKCSNRDTPQCNTCQLVDDFIKSEPTTVARREIPALDLGIKEPRCLPSSKIFRHNDTSVRHPDKRRLRDEAKELGVLDDLTIQQQQVFIDACDTSVEFDLEETAKAMRVSPQTVRRATKYISVKIAEARENKK